jgi:hypothetical protein
MITYWFRSFLPIFGEKNWRFSLKKATFTPNFRQFLCRKYFKNHNIGSWGRCYDQNILRFSTIFGEKMGVFLKNQCYDQFFSKFNFVSSQKR